MGKETIHFEAPPASKVLSEMNAFLDWIEKYTYLDAVLKAGIAHLWFVTIHPFDDGNGRIARAITDMLLARADKSPQRFYSMSAQLQAERNKYYNILESTQKETNLLEMKKHISKYLKQNLSNLLIPKNYYIGFLTILYNSSSSFLTKMICQSNQLPAVCSLKIF
jgi:Fic family protein